VLHQRRPLYDEVFEKGRENAVAGFYLRFAWLVIDMSLPDCAVENLKFREFISFCFTKGSQLKQHGRASLLGQQKQSTIRKHDLLHSFRCIRSANTTRVFFQKRYGKTLPFAIAMCDHLDKPEDILGVSLIIINPLRGRLITSCFVYCLQMDTDRGNQGTNYTCFVRTSWYFKLRNCDMHDRHNKQRPKNVKAGHWECNGGQMQYACMESRFRPIDWPKKAHQGGIFRFCEDLIQKRL
jgi:hypothetical protein